MEEIYNYNIHFRYDEGPDDDDDDDDDDDGDDEFTS